MVGEHETALDAFREKEATKLIRIENYVHDARRNSTPLHREAQEGMSASGALDWAAVNTDVRITALGMLLEALETLTPELGKSGKRVSSVVMTSEHWMAPLDGAHDEIVEMIRKEANDRFRGQHFVGMIEPAFYPRYPVGRLRTKKLISWHAHLLFWGKDRQELEDAITAFNDETEGPLYGVAPASVRRRSWQSAPECLSYMMKTPAKSHTTLRIQERMNPETGEFFAEHDKQHAQALRTGEHVKMLNVLREFTLDKLFLVGGKGHVLVKDLRQRIERDRERYEQQRRKSLPGFGRGVGSGSVFG